MLKDSVADLWHFLISNRIKILLKRYIFNHDKSYIQMMLLVRLRATKHRNLGIAGDSRNSRDWDILLVRPMLCCHATTSVSHLD